jgi:hypothetical protein
LIQGLSNQSFVEGSGTNIQVRAGTTTAIKATDELANLDEAEVFSTVPYSQVNTPPKIRYKPTLEVPEAIIELEMEGRVEVELIVSAEGKVINILIINGLHPEADEACKRSLLRSRWKAGTANGREVKVLSVPFACTFKMAID